MFTTDHHQP